MLVCVEYVLPGACLPSDDLAAAFLFAATLQSATPGMDAFFRTWRSTGASVIAQSQSC